MALILSAATGNFDAGATWVGGVVPTVGDEARAATGHTITINVNTTCDEVSNAGTGIYTLASGITLTANCTSKSTTASRNLLQFTDASPAVGFIVGNVLGGTATSAVGCINTSTGTLTITGNATGGSGTTAYGCNNNSSGTLTVTGNATGGSGANTFGCNNTSSGTLNITGNATGGSGSSSAIGCNNGSTGTLTITGNATGGSGGTAYGCNNNSTGTLNMTGNATGGSGTSAYGGNNNSTGTLTITGNATGGNGITADGCRNTSTGTLTITGIGTGGTTNGAAGVNNNSTGTLNAGRAKGNDFGIGSTGIAAGFGVTSAQSSITKIKEFEFGARGMSPTSGPIFIEPVLGNLAIFQEYPTGSKTLSDPNNTAGLSPATTDVRTGVVYNNGNDTGTCAVPAAASVGFGVPVDATTGTAALTPAAVWDHLLSAITTSDTIGKLLKDNVDATISSRSTATTAGIADAVWDEEMSGHTTSGTYGGRIVRSLNSNNTLQLTGSHHAAADIHEFQSGVISSVAFDASALTAFAVPELQEIHLIHGLKSGSALTVTPSSRAAGAISQNIAGDGVASSTVTRV